MAGYFRDRAARAAVDILIVVLFAFVVLHSVTVGVPCVCCGKEAYREPVLARVTYGWRGTHMHDYCVYRWLNDE